MVHQLTDCLRAPITTLADGEAFIRELVDQDLSYHFDDGAVDCLHGNGLLTLDEAKVVDAQVAALYGLDWGKAQCPIGFCLHVHAERDEADRESCLLPHDWRPAA